MIAGIVARGICEITKFRLPSDEPTNRTCALDSVGLFSQRHRIGFVLWRLLVALGLMLVGAGLGAIAGLIVGIIYSVRLTRRADA
jgi:hypothetical protein